MAVAKPIQIVPLHDLAAAAPAARPRLTYRGGPVLPAVEVFDIFWGVAWSRAPSPRSFRRSTSSSTSF